MDGKKFTEWKGIPRDEIKWNPKVDEGKCAGCGMCVTSCGRGVYKYDFERKKAIVANPQRCMVGCTSCETWCVFNAISFPDKQYVKGIIKDRKVLARAKRELEEKRGSLKSE